ncbi:hypothetical protein FKM82_021433 [Ascaphus truei]
MPPMHMCIILFFIAVGSLLGILSNLFIVLVNLLNWFKGRKFNRCDLILTSLGISNICFQCSTTVDKIIFIAFRDLYFTKNIYLFYCPGMVLFINPNSWFTTRLCVYYCIKIVNRNTHLFIWLKQHISSIVPWVLLGSAVGSVGIALPAIWNIYIVLPGNTTANYSVDDIEIRWSLPYAGTTGFLVVICPFLLVVLSIALILVSLCQHVVNMKENASGFSKPNLKAHIGAANTIMSLLLSYLVFNIAETLLITNVFPVDSPGYVLCWALIMGFTISQSLILIPGNPKLKKALRRFLCFAKR